MDLDLTVHEQALLDFEREWWSFDGRKEDLIRERFASRRAVTTELLQALLDMDAAADYDPLTVKRLRKRRDQRRRAGWKGAGPIRAQGKREPVADRAE